MSKKEDIVEIDSLNLDDLDVEELERRMELAIAGGQTTSYIEPCDVDGGGGCNSDGCGSNTCTSNCNAYCGSNCDSKCGTKMYLKVDTF